jgi:hypothetical protein
VFVVRKPGRRRRESGAAAGRKERLQGQDRGDGEAGREGDCYHHNLARLEGGPRERWAQRIIVMGLQIGSYRAV